MIGRAKNGYMRYASIEAKIQSGEIDAYDVIYTTDTHENYVISPELEPWVVRSRVYVFDSVEDANTQLNANTDTYVGQIVSIIVEDKCKGYIVNRDSGGNFYVSKLTEDDISENGIIYIKGTLSNKLIISELGEGIFSIEGQYQIVPGGTVFTSMSKVLFVCGNNSVHEVNGKEVIRYSYEDGVLNTEKYITDADLGEYIKRDEASEMISELIGQDIDGIVVDTLANHIAKEEDLDGLF